MSQTIDHLFVTQTLWVSNSNATFRLSPGAASGYVLTSDAMGVASWQGIIGLPGPGASILVNSTSQVAGNGEQITLKGNAGISGGDSFVVAVNAANAVAGLYGVFGGVAMAGSLTNSPFNIIVNVTTSATFTQPAFTFFCTDAATNTVTVAQVIAHNTSGTPATGFGSGLQWQLDSATVPNRAAAEIDVSWNNATDLTRAGLLRLVVYSVSTAQEGMRILAASGGVQIGFFGVAAVAQQANASQATINLIADGNAKAAAQSFYNALKNLGLCAATP